MTNRQDDLHIAVRIHSGEPTTLATQLKPHVRAIDALEDEVGLTSGAPDEVGESRAYGLLMSICDIRLLGANVARWVG